MRHQRPTAVLVATATMQLCQFPQISAQITELNGARILAQIGGLFTTVVTFQQTIWKLLGGTYAG